jgi:hypothetical protein
LDFVYGDLVDTIIRPLEPSSAQPLGVVRAWSPDAASQRQEFGRLDNTDQRDDPPRRIRRAAERQAADELDALDLALTELLAQLERS